MDTPERLSIEAEMKSTEQLITHGDFIERLRSLQDALVFTSFPMELQRQIFKDLNDINIKIFCDETKTQ